MSFTITLQPSGAIFSVGRDETILSSAIANGVGLPYGCKDGACGSCKCKILEGRVIHGAHQAKALSVEEEEAGYTLTCCAAAQTDLVLEVRTVASSREFPHSQTSTRRGGAPFATACQ
jgi:CDP-4-dehydro-6-deoxyglucose reductase, E3